MSDQETTDDSDSASSGLRRETAAWISSAQRAISEGVARHLRHLAAL